MRSKLTLSITLGLSMVLLTLISSETRVQTQNQFRVVADTGMVILGPNQVLRTSVVSVDGELGGGIYGEIRSRQTNYTQDACTGGVCKFTIASQNLSAPIPLMRREALSFEVGPDIHGNAVRSLILSSRRNVGVNVMIVDTVTGNVQSLQLQTQIQRENQ